MVKSHYLKIIFGYKASKIFLKLWYFIFVSSYISTFFYFIYVSIFKHKQTQYSSILKKKLNYFNFYQSIKTRMLHKFVYYHCSGTMLVFSSFFILILLYVLPKQRPNFFFFFLRGCLESNTPWFKVVQGTFERAIAQGRLMNPLLKIIILGIFPTELSDYKTLFIS